MQHSGDFCNHIPAVAGVNVLMAEYDRAERTSAGVAVNELSLPSPIYLSPLG